MWHVRVWEKNITTTHHVCPLDWRFRSPVASGDEREYKQEGDSRSAASWRRKRSRCHIAAECTMHLQHHARLAAPWTHPRIVVNCSPLFLPRTRSTSSVCSCIHSYPPSPHPRSQLSHFAFTGLITLFITRQPTQSGEFGAGSNSNGDSERAHAGLICQPCETMGQGLVMWFRWVSHAGVSQPSPLSAPATVPHYTPCHHRLHLQQALCSLTQGHPFFFFFSVSLLKGQKGIRKEGKKKKKKKMHQDSLSSFLRLFTLVAVAKGFAIKSLSEI